MKKAAPDWRGPKVTNVETSHLVKRLDQFLQVVLGDFLFGHFRAGNDVVDHLVFKDRRAQLLLHLIVLLDKIEIGPFLPRILPGLRQHRLGHFGIGDGDLGLAADFGQHQPQTHPAHREGLVLVRRLDGIVVVTVVLRVSSCHSW